LITDFSSINNKQFKGYRVLDIFFVNVAMLEEQTSSSLSSSFSFEARSKHAGKATEHTLYCHTREIYATEAIWIEQCFTSQPTQYRLYGRRFIVKQTTDVITDKAEGQSWESRQTTSTQQGL